MKTKILIMLTASLLVITSCSKKDIAETSTITKDEATVNSKIDLANDDISTIVEDQYNNIDSNTLSGKNNDITFSACAISIIRTPNYGTPLNSGDQVTKTIDFGTGCELANNNHVSGKIIMSFVYQPSATSHTVTYTFDNFYHNYMKIEGTKTFTLSMTAATTTSPSHPIVVMNMDLTATINGAVHHRVGSRTREIIEGYATGTIIDNIYRVTGSWTTTHPDSTVLSDISTPLIVKMSCINTHKPLIVQGVITFTKNNHTATLNYGTGACDNLAVFTINGNSYDIVIGN